ncbi:MAG: 4Fe-4S dicluster domain-containing protein [Anaerolineae bacterium]
MAATNQDILSPFLAEVLETQGGRLVLQCYQCGTCSGSCPVIDEMEYGPRRILHLIQMGEEEAVLSSNDMWRCVSCYSCANRCPRGIEITDLMADLRRLAIEKGYAKDKEAEFGLAFAETVQAHGRMFEPELLTRYYLRVLDAVSLIRMVPLGLKMLVKGKLPFLPERIEDPKEMDKIGVTDSTRLRMATGVSGGRPSDVRKILGGALGGALLALIAGVAFAWGKDKSR